MCEDWRNYENEILALLKEEYPDADIKPNQKRPGRYSKVERQIDVLVEGRIAGNPFAIVVDGKHYKRKVDVKGVEEFIGMVHDIGAHKGLIVTQEGYSEGALQRAYNDPHDIELDILSFKELKEYQGLAGIPYRVPHGVSLAAPFGWIIDGANYGPRAPRAHLYQRGLTLDAAIDAHEFMYVRIWDRTDNRDTIDIVNAVQEANLREVDPDAVFQYPATVRRPDAETRLRETKVARLGDLREFAGFVQFEDFIFVLVLQTPEVLAKKNVRKLESVMLSAQPLKIVEGGQKAI